MSFLSIVDKQLAPSHNWLNRLAIIFLVVILAIACTVLGVYWQKAADPYAQAVISLEGDANKGLAIFQINCAGCHNLTVERSVGPRLENISKRKSQREIITQVTSGRTPPMPKFQPSQQEMADLLSYLKEL